jgi:hypothetical protein
MLDLDYKCIIRDIKSFFSSARGIGTPIVIDKTPKAYNMKFKAHYVPKHFAT